MPSIFPPTDTVLHAFQSKFPYKFRNIDHLKTALTISDKLLPELTDSRLTGSDADNFERYKRFEEFEFMGDKILGIIVSEIMFLNHSGYGPGELTRKYEVFTKNADDNHRSGGSKLYRLSRAWGVDRVIDATSIAHKLKDERIYKIPKTKSALTMQNKYADVAEALIGAIYQDHIDNGQDMGDVLRVVRDLIKGHYKIMGIYSVEDEVRSYATSPISLRSRLDEDDVAQDKRKLITLLSDSLKERKFDEFEGLLSGFPDLERSVDLHRFVRQTYLQSCIRCDFDVAQIMIKNFPQLVMTMRDEALDDKLVHHHALSRGGYEILDLLLAPAAREHLETIDFIELARMRLENMSIDDVDLFKEGADDLIAFCFNKKHMPQMESFLMNLGSVLPREKINIVCESCTERFLENKSSSLFRFLVANEILKKDLPRVKFEQIIKSVSQKISEDHDFDHISDANLEEVISKTAEEVIGLIKFIQKPQPVFARLAARREEAAAREFVGDGKAEEDNVPEWRRPSNNPGRTFAGKSHAFSGRGGRGGWHG